MEITKTPHALYRFFDEGGELLYIGITNNPTARFRQHGSDKDWWHEVATIRMERYSSRDAVLVAEKRAIIEEKPRYNVVHAAGTLTPGDAYAVLCESCLQPATLACVLTSDRYAYRKHRDEWTKNPIMRGRDFVSEPVWPAPWHVTCKEHFPGEFEDYWADLEGSRRGAVDLIRHLGEKEWVGEETDFATLAVRLLAPIEAALPRGVAW